MIRGTEKLKKKPRFTKENVFRITVLLASIFMCTIFSIVPTISGNISDISKIVIIFVISFVFQAGLIILYFKAK